MTILSYKLDTTNDLLTSRAGLLAISQLMSSLNFSQRVDQYFPAPQSNRGYKPSEFINTFILMQHEGSCHLDDVHRIHDDDALRAVLGLHCIPQATSMGDWLRRMGNTAGIQDAWVGVNQLLLQASLHRCKMVTLDIDATEIVSQKSNAQWTYNKNKGFMPMVGHIAQTGQIVAIDFRKGNDSPAKDNLGFIKQCQESLPQYCRLGALRIDAAGYQSNIIEYCDKNDIEYAIRAKTSALMREQIKSVKPTQWQPLQDKQGNPVKGQDTYRTSFCIGDYENAFTLVIQRKAIDGQHRLDFEEQNNPQEIHSAGYVYRAIATNRDNLSDSEIIHWYNQRAEDSENRIKELKCDFGGNTLPCSDFNANGLYLLICALSFNLFALMRQLLPQKWAQHRAMTIRWRLYGIAAKVVRSGRRMFVKVQTKHKETLEQAIAAMRTIDPPPI